MIEVNLLPGAKKKSRRKGKSINIGQIVTAISEKVKDKYLAAAVVTGALAVAAIVLLFLSQRNRETELRRIEKVAVDDSTKFAAAMNERARVRARRDSALIQLNIIRAIDEERFIWPHIMDEVSRALPPYTWLSVMNIAGDRQGERPAAAIRMPSAAASTKSKDAKSKGKTGAAKVPTMPVIPRDTVRFRLVGRTVDIQAFTRFMRTLEDSPFIESVQMEKTEVAIEGGKEVTQFTLNMKYTRPDSTLIRRVPLAYAQR
jgi:Tfp pilus assembly protein PilN